MFSYVRYNFCLSFVMDNFGLTGIAYGTCLFLILDDLDSTIFRGLKISFSKSPCYTHGKYCPKRPNRPNDKHKYTRVFITLHDLHSPFQFGSFFDFNYFVKSLIGLLQRC